MPQIFKIKLQPNHKFFIGLKEYFFSYQEKSNKILLKQYNLHENIDKIISAIIFSFTEEVKYSNPEVDINDEINVVIYDDSSLCFDYNINKVLKEQNIGDLLFELTNILCLYLNEESTKQKYSIN